MTSKVMLVCNGPSYVLKYSKVNKASEVIQQGKIRGGDTSQAFIEIYVGQDETIEITEVYEPKEE